MKEVGTGMNNMIGKMLDNSRMADIIDISGRKYGRRKIEVI